jgi:hypothetical protein
MQLESKKLYKYFFCKISLPILKLLAIFLTVIKHYQTGMLCRICQCFVVAGLLYKKFGHKMFV